MRIAYLVRTGIIVSPFGDPVGETPVLNRPLREQQLETLKTCGYRGEFVDRNDLRPTKQSGTLVLEDQLYFSPELLSDFLKKSEESGFEACRAVLKKGLFTRQLAILHGFPENESIVEFPLCWYRNGYQENTPVRNIVLDVDEFSEAGGFPPHMIGREEYRFGLTTRPLLAVNSALHTGLVNMAANFARVARFRRLTPGQKLKTLIRARSLSKPRLLQALSVIEPGAEVHPTAVVEGSIIRSGARVGAYAVIRHSVIDRKAFIDDHAGIKFSVVGEGAYVANNNVLFFTTVYPRAFLISGPYHFSVFGCDSAIMNSIPSDYRLDGKTIKVKTSRGVEDTGLRFAGSVIGHRTRIAAGLIIAPGREIPNDLELYPDPARVLGKVDPQLPQQGKRFFLVDGKLVAQP